MLSSKLLPLACLSHATRKSARHFQDISLQEAIIRAWAMQRLHKASSKILDLSVVAFRLWHENQPLTWGNLGGDGFTGFTFGSRSLTGGCCNIHSVDSAHLLTAPKKNLPLYWHCGNTTSPVRHCHPLSVAMLRSRQLGALEMVFNARQVATLLTSGPQLNT